MFVFHAESLQQFYHIAGEKGILFRESRGGRALDHAAACIRGRTFVCMIASISRMSMLSFAS